MVALAYLLLVRLIAPLVKGRTIRQVELEKAVLRHQLQVLRRTVRRPELRDRDRAFLAAASKAPSRDRWASFMVTPQTLLRMAPRARAAKVDPPSSWVRETRSGSGGRRAHCPPGPGEPQMGVHPDPGRAPQARYRCGGEHRPEDPSPPRPRTGSTLGRPDVERSSASRRGGLACDFFTVETAFRKTLYVLFFIDLSTRRVHIAGATTRPDWVWVTQQARNLTMVGTLDGRRFLIRDRDTKFSGPFDEVFRTEGVAVVKTPVQAPKANAAAERWVGTVRRECLDHILILGRRHLERVLTIYAAHYG